jgi:hypothetical protein
MIVQQFTLCPFYTIVELETTSASDSDLSSIFDVVEDALDAALGVEIPVQIQ